MQPKPVQRPHPPFVIGGGGPKVLALAAREAQIVGINANLRVGRRHSQRRRELAHERSHRREARSGCATPRAPRFDDLEIQTLAGFVHVTDDRTRSPTAMAKSFGVTPDDAILGAGDARRHRSTDRRSARGPPRTLADELHGRTPRVHGRSSRRSSRRLAGYLKERAAMTHKFRFGVQVSGTPRAKPGATRRRRSRSSATRRSTCPTTSSTPGSRRCPRSRWRPRTRRRCASARSCSTTTTSTRRSSPRRWRRSTCSPTAAASSASARAG